MKRTFTYNGKTYSTLTAIANEIGVKRVYTRDFAKYGIVETTAVDTIVKSVNILDDAADVPVADVPADDAQEDVPADVTSNDDAVDDVPVADVSANPLNTGGSQIIFAHMVDDGMAIDKVVDIPTSSGDEVDEPADNTAADAVEDDTTEVTADDTQNDTADAVDDTVEVTAGKPVDEPKPVVKPKKPLTEAELIAQVERDVVDYADAKELGDNVKKISLGGLIQMVKNVQGDTWERISHEGVRKMRLIMELKKIYFPTAADVPAKPAVPSTPSPWKKIPTADLKAAVINAGGTWKDCANEGILRMRLIMAAKKAGLDAADIQK